jgi:YVTN family beta-propeller protein
MSWASTLPSTIRKRRLTRPCGRLLAAIALGMAVILQAAARDVSGPPLPLRTIVDIPLAGGSSRLDYQSLDQRAGLLFIAHLGAGMVSVLDTRLNRIVATIPHVAGVHGVLAVPALRRVYASATDDNQVAVIDERTLRVIARVPGGDYPDGLAYDPVAHTVFVSDEAGGTDTVIDTRTNRRIATIPLGGEAGNTQDDPVSRRMFVDVQTLNQLVAINPATDHIMARYSLPTTCQHDHSQLVDAPHRLAFIACDGNARLLVFDLASLRVTSVQTVGDSPDVLAFDSRVQRLYVAAKMLSRQTAPMFDEHGRTLHKVAEGFVATEAHVIAVDSRTHRLYLLLQDVGGKPVLRVALLR